MHTDNTKKVELICINLIPKRIRFCDVTRTKQWSYGGQMMI